MNGLVAIAAILAGLIGFGAVIRLFGPRQLDWRWLLISAALVLLNDALLTRGYGLVPDALPALAWNWEGKLAALAATLAVAALPAFGWRRSGLTLAQAPGSLASAVPVALGYCLIFVGLALAFPADRPTREELLFQLTMPGLEEEAFSRGLLLLALMRAFPARWGALGVEWSWGALASSLLFGLGHAFSYDGGFAFDPLVMTFTAGPSLVAVWLRLRTGSILLPVLVHNFGNSIGYLV